jgi:hypothetical protein
MDEWLEYGILCIGWIVGISFLWTFRFEWVGVFSTILIFIGICSLTARMVLLDTTKEGAITKTVQFFQIAFFLIWFGTLLLQLGTASYLALFFFYIWKEFNQRASFTEFTRGLFAKWHAVKVAWTFYGFFSILSIAFAFYKLTTTSTPNATLLHVLGTVLISGMAISSILGIINMSSLYRSRYNIQPQRETASTRQGKIKPIYPYDELLRHNTIAQLSNYSYKGLP